MKRFKQPKTAVTISRKEKAMLLVLVAAVDELGLTENQLCEIATRASRYAGYIDDHLVQMEDVRKSIEKNTGVKLKGWAR